MSSTFTRRNNRSSHGEISRCNPLQQLAECFIDEDAQNDLHVAVTGYDGEGELREWPWGQWLRTVDFIGSAMVCEEMSAFEIRARVYNFLVRVEAEISVSLVLDVVEVAKFALAERDKKLLTYRVEVAEPWRAAR